MTQPSDDSTRPEAARTPQDAPLPSESPAPGRAPEPAPRGADTTAERPADATAPTGQEPAGTRRKDSPATPPAEAPKSGGRTAMLWISLILGAIVLVLLLIFVIQNSQKASFEYFSATFDLPLGVAMLLAAIAGALVMALVGSVRMAQMSWTIRKMRKQQEKIQRAAR